jgi:hypothetical protein
MKNKVDKMHASVNSKNWKDIPDTTIDKSKGYKLIWDLYNLSGKSNPPDPSIRLNYLMEFRKDYKMSSYTDEVDRMIKEISKNYDYLYYDSPGHDLDHTNYLAKYSDNYGLIYEKRISSDYEANRFTYRINKPIINRNGDIIVYVDLLGCSFHKLNFKGGGSRSFSESSDDFWKIRTLSELPW